MPERSSRSFFIPADSWFLTVCTLMPSFPAISAGVSSSNFAIPTMIFCCIGKRLRLYFTSLTISSYSKEECVLQSLLSFSSTYSSNTGDATLALKALMSRYFDIWKSRGRRDSTGFSLWRFVHRQINTSWTISSASSADFVNCNE